MNKQKYRHTFGDWSGSRPASRTVGRLTKLCFLAPFLNAVCNKTPINDGFIVFSLITIIPRIEYAWFL